jgi:hypothetical protein
MFYVVSVTLAIVGPSLAQYIPILYSPPSGLLFALLVCAVITLRRYPTNTVHIHNYSFED